jgi:hypothetical protein
VRTHSQRSWVPQPFGFSAKAGPRAVMVVAGLPTGRGRGSFGTLRTGPRHTDWFFFFRVHVFFVLGIFFFAFFLLVLFLFFKFFFGPGVVAHAVVGDGAGIDDDPLEVTGLKLQLAKVEPPSETSP